MKFSYSKLSVFLSCPLRFKFKYLDKDKIEDVTDSYSTYLGRGVHKALEELYGNKDKDLDWLEDRWSVICSEMIEEGQTKTDVFTPNNITIFKNHGRKIIRGYFETYKHEFQSENHVSIALEKHFDTQLKDFRLTGVIDKVEKINSEIHVVDYKTGSPLTQKEADENLQLSFYAVACRKAGLSLNKVNFCFHYVKDNIKVFTHRTIDDIKLLYETLSNAREKINNNDFEATPSASNCKFCGFKKYCSSYQEFVKNGKSK